MFPFFQEEKEIDYSNLIFRGPEGNRTPTCCDDERAIYLSRAHSDQDSKRILQYPYKKTSKNQRKA